MINDHTPATAASRARRPWRTAVLAVTLVAAPLTALLAFPHTAEAAGTPLWGYAWASQPATTDYTPDLNYQAQSNGRRVSIHRNGTGDYVVTFPGLASAANGGIVQATAYRSAGACQSDGWHASGSDIVATVLCFNPGAIPADMSFDVTYTVGAGTPSFAYAWDNLASSSGSVASYWSFDGRGGAISSTHLGTGNYLVQMPNLAAGDGTVMVTAYGPNERMCSVLSWGGTGLSVHVFCTNIYAQPQDTLFTISFGNQIPLIGVGGHRNGYLWNYYQGSSYTAGGPYTFDSSGGAVTVTHLDTGVYAVHFAGFSGFGDVQVSVYGAVSYNCNPNSWCGGMCDVGYWESDSTGELVVVDCNYLNGSGPRDSLFTVQYSI